jgi:predicted phage replisome organizer
MFDKRKIKKIRRLPAGNDLLLIWIMLLAMAGKCNAGGMIYITESVPFTEEDLADELDFDLNTVKLALTAFRELDMIATDEDGFINVLGWEEYQNTDRLAEIREYNRLAKQKSREKKKLLQGVNDNVNDMSMTSQCCQDIEEEKEEDKEKENHSFTLSDDEKALDEYIRDKVEESGLMGSSAEEYREHIKKNMQIKLMGGSLGQNILRMSDEQFDDLCTRLSFDELHRYINIVVECEKNGKPYTRKTHYQAILDMVNKDRRIKR